MRIIASIALLVLLLALPSIAFAASTATVTITAVPSGSQPYAPTNFTVTRVDNNTVLISWTPGLNTDSTVITIKLGGYADSPTDTDAITIYSGGGASFTYDDLNLDNIDYYYKAWGHSVALGYSADFSTKHAGGKNMLELMFTLIPLALTFLMFHTRNMMLGFPSGMFWAITGGYAYQQSESEWDIQYLLFFASMGMAIFCIYAAFALRKRDLEPADGDWGDSGRYVDEGKDGLPKESQEYIDEPSKPNRRTLAIRKRAQDRRSGGTKRKQDWGEFR